MANEKRHEQTFRMLAIFAPPLPITFPTALAGTNISKVEGGGNLQKCIKSAWMKSIDAKTKNILSQELKTKNTNPPYSLDDEYEDIEP